MGYHRLMFEEGFEEMMDIIEEEPSGLYDGNNSTGRGNGQASGSKGARP